MTDILYTLTVGTLEPSGYVHSTDAVQAQAWATLHAAGAQGASMSTVQGYWTDGSGQPVVETSVQVQVVGSAAMAPDIHGAAQALATMFGQDCVMVTETALGQVAFVPAAQ